MKKQTKNGVIKPKNEEKITDLTLSMPRVQLQWDVVVDNIFEMFEFGA